MRARYRSHQCSGQRELNGSIMNITQWAVSDENKPQGGQQYQITCTGHPTHRRIPWTRTFRYLRCESMTTLQETLAR